MIDQESSDNFFMKRIKTWKVTFAFFPKKCAVSDKKIFLKYAYKGTYMLTGPGDPIFINYWVDKTEFLLWNLKGRK